jgi:hypothetical protein
VTCGARDAWRLDDPLGRSEADLIGASFAGSIVRNWNRIGFSSGHPAWHVWPTQPPTVHCYDHHPPGVFWASYFTGRLLGFDEVALRLVPFLCTLLTTALLSALLGARSAWLGAAFLGLHATMPMMIEYGTMANYESPVALVLAGGVAAYVFGGRRPLARILLVLLAAIGPWLDWAAVFLAPALFLWELMRPRGLRDFRWPSVVAVVMAASAMAFVVAIWAWHGDIVLALANLVHAAAGATVNHGIGQSGWLGRYAGHLAVAHGWLSLALGVGGAALAVKSRFREAAKVAAALALPGLLNVVCFPMPAAIHVFWNFYLTAPIAIFGALAIASLRRRFGRGTAIAVLLACSVTNLVVGFQRVHRDASAAPRELGRAISAMIAPDDLLVTPVALDTARFYVAPWVLDVVTTPVEVDQIIGTWRRGRFGTRRVVFHVPHAFRDAFAAVEAAADGGGTRVDLADGVAWFLGPPASPPR